LCPCTPGAEGDEPGRQFRLVCLTSQHANASAPPAPRSTTTWKTLGQEGWERVAVIPDYESDMWFFFKREIQEKA
jgi:hypothetical protein